MKIEKETIKTNAAHAAHQARRVVAKTALGYNETVKVVRPYSRSAGLTDILEAKREQSNDCKYSTLITQSKLVEGEFSHDLKALESCKC